MPEATYNIGRRVFKMIATIYISRDKISASKTMIKAWNICVHAVIYPQSLGTIAAILTTSFVYVTSVFFYAGSVEGVLARDKFGLSVRKKLVIANLAWPNEWVILVGSLLSTVGAGLQVLFQK